MAERALAFRLLARLQSPVNQQKTRLARTRKLSGSTNSRRMTHEQRRKLREYGHDRSQLPRHYRGRERKVPWHASEEHCSLLLSLPNGHGRRTLTATRAATLNRERWRCFSRKAILSGSPGLGGDRSITERPAQLDCHEVGFWNQTQVPCAQALLPAAIPDHEQVITGLKRPTQSGIAAKIA
jgi:hypothetical protein